MVSLMRVTWGSGRLLGCSLLGAIALVPLCAPPTLAQALPTLPPASQETPDETSPETPSPEIPSPEIPSPEIPSTANAIELNLPDLINIVIQGNRDLKNAVLERVVQRQTLTEEESRFSPQITPNFSVRAEQDLSDTDLGANPAGFDDNAATLGLGDRTTLTQSLNVSSTLRTPLGTALELSVDPINEASQVNLTVSQPLLRGAGRAVNVAPVQQARIAESNNKLTLRQQVIDTITTTITQYTTLIQSQEAVTIQAQALERRRQQFEIINALVEVGRRAMVDLVDSERSIAEAELGLQTAINQLSQANTDLLTLVGAEGTLQFVAPTDAIDQLFTAAIARFSEFEVNQLIELAYQLRPDYQQAQAQIEIEDLNLLLAQDNRRWDLNWESTARLGNASPQAATALQLRRTFGDESLNSAVERSQTSRLQQQNTVDQLTETIRNQIIDQLGDVTSELAQVDAAQRATEATQLQLQITQEKFRRGRDGITLFDITQQEENLVAAQNAELQARISVLNSVAGLEQTVGITLQTWQSSVDFSPVLAAEEAVLEAD